MDKEHCVGFFTQRGWEALRHSRDPCTSLSGTEKPRWRYCCPRRMTEQPVRASMWLQSLWFSESFWRDKLFQCVGFYEVLVSARGIWVDVQKTLFITIVWSGPESHITLKSQWQSLPHQIIHDNEMASQSGKVDWMSI